MPERLDDVRCPVYVAWTSPSCPSVTSCPRAPQGPYRRPARTARNLRRWRPRTASWCRLPGRGFRARTWRCRGLDRLTGDEDGQDQADEGDHEHHGKGDGEGLAGVLSHRQGRARAGPADGSAGAAEPPSTPAQADHASARLPPLGYCAVVWSCTASWSSFSSSLDREGSAMTNPFHGSSFSPCSAPERAWHFILVQLESVGYAPNPAVCAPPIPHPAWVSSVPFRPARLTGWPADRPGHRARMMSNAVIVRGNGVTGDETAPAVDGVNWFSPVGSHRGSTRFRG